MSKYVPHREVRNSDWGVWQNDNGKYDWDAVNRAIALDIRDELRALNRVFACPNVQAGFRALQVIAKANEVAFKRRVRAAVKKQLKRRTK